MKRQTLTMLLLIFTLVGCTRPAAPSASPTSPTPTAAEGMSGMNMGDPSSGDGLNQSGTTDAMSNHQMEMGPHMKMTATHPQNPDDDARAAQISAQARAALSKYRDYKLAERDGYKPFLPNLPLEEYHFTNYANSLAAGVRFDPTKPGSLLYKKVGDGYQLIGVMYTAPARFSEDQLNARYPLSVAQWHQHVNICLPPAGLGSTAGTWTRFGPAGSIVSEADCQAVGGKFYPRIFGWMLHIYPFDGQ